MQARKITLPFFYRQVTQTFLPQIGPNLDFWSQTAILVYWKVRSTSEVLRKLPYTLHHTYRPYIIDHSPTKEPQLQDTDHIQHICIKLTGKRQRRDFSEKKSALGRLTSRE